ncbi:MAG: hypothetical protein KAI24_13265 [Planctomycetes bacterium]|nr:hypothetical protein [Planctomycetota bacterium]
MRNRRLPTFLFLALSTLCACGGGELVGVHVDLAADGSGKVTLRTLAPTDDAPAAATRTAGAKWTVHAGLVASQGTFAKVAELQLADGDVTFAPQLDGDRPGLRVKLARGREARWVSLLTPDLATRRKLAKAYDPTGRTNEIGDVLRLEIRTPGRVITSGVLPTGRGVESDRDGKTAILLLPAATVLADGDDFVWDVSWLDG